jgi:hypothetical protein
MRESEMSGSLALTPAFREQRRPKLQNGTEQASTGETDISLSQIN